MKRTAAVMLLLAMVAAAAGVAYQAAARERDYRLLLNRGDVALREGKTFDAVEAYSGAIALRPDSMLGYLRRGETYQQRSDVNAAARDFSRATSLDPSAPRPLEDLGDVQYRRQRFQQAADAYERRLRLDDRSASIAHKLALARYRLGDLDGALTAVSQALALNGRLADAYYLRGLCLRDAHRTPDALTAFEQAVAISPGLIPAREEMADLYGALGRNADELEQLQLLAGLDRAHVERQVAVGMAHARAGHWDLAVLTLGGALERAPNDPVIFQALGRIWLDRPRNDRVYVSKAREALERIASSPDAASDVLALYGRALLDDGDVEAAERTLEQAVAHYPVDPAALLAYAAAAERRKHWDAARDALVRYDVLVAAPGTNAFRSPASPAVASDGIDGEVTISGVNLDGGGAPAGAPTTVAARAARAARIGALSIKMNDLDGAIAWLRRAADLTPDDVRLLASLADTQLKRGDADGAQTVVARALEQAPADRALLALSRRIRTALAADVSAATPATATTAATGTPSAP